MSAIPRNVIDTGLPSHPALVIRPGHTPIDLTVSGTDPAHCSPFGGIRVTLPETASPLRSTVFGIADSRAASPLPV